MQQDSSPEISPSVGPEEARPSSGGWLIFLDPAAWLVFGLALGLDQLTKWLVTSNMARSQSIPEEGFFRITYVWNTGSAFGLFTGQGEILTVVSLAAVALLLFFYRHAGQESLIVRLAIGLQLGGAAGNIVDRFRLGHVTDFIDVGPWPIFNLADSSIVVGITIMVVYFLYTRERYVSPPVEAAANHQQPSQISPPAECAGDPSGPRAENAPMDEDRG